MEAVVLNNSTMLSATKLQGQTYSNYKFQNEDISPSEFQMNGNDFANFGTWSNMKICNSYGNKGKLKYQSPVTKGRDYTNGQNGHSAIDNGDDLMNHNNSSTGLSQVCTKNTPNINVFSANHRNGRTNKSKKPKLPKENGNASFVPQRTTRSSIKKGNETTQTNALQSENEIDKPSEVFNPPTHDIQIISDPKDIPHNSEPILPLNKKNKNNSKIPGGKRRVPKIIIRDSYKKKKKVKPFFNDINEINRKQNVHAKSMCNNDHYFDMKKQLAISYDLHNQYMQAFSSNLNKMYSSNEVHNSAFSSNRNVSEHSGYTRNDQSSSGSLPYHIPTAAPVPLTDSNKHPSIECIDITEVDNVLLSNNSSHCAKRKNKQSPSDKKKTKKAKIAANPQPPKDHSIDQTGLPPVDEKTVAEFQPKETLSIIQSSEADASHTTVDINIPVSNDANNHQDNTQIVDSQRHILSQLLLLNLVKVLSSSSKEENCSVHNNSEDVGEKQNLSHLPILKIPNPKEMFKTKCSDEESQDFKAKELVSDEEEESDCDKKLRSRSSSVCTDELLEHEFDDNNMEQHYKQFKLTSDEEREMENSEWNLWMDNLRNPTKKEIPSEKCSDTVDIQAEDSDDIDIILLNVREVISKKNDEEETIANTTDYNSVKPNSSSTDDIEMLHQVNNIHQSHIGNGLIEVRNIIPFLPIYYF